MDNTTFSDIDLTGEGDFDLPPGVAPGSLGGAEPDEEPQPTPEPQSEDVPPADVPWDGQVTEGSLGGTDEPPEAEAEEEELRGAAALDALEAEDEGPPVDSKLGVTTDDLTPEAEAAEAAAAEVIEPVTEPDTEVEVTPAPEGKTPVEETPPSETPPAKQKASRKRGPRKKKAPAPAQQQPQAAVKSSSGTMDRTYKIFHMQQTEVGGQIVEVPVEVTFTAPDGGDLEGIRARNRDLALSRAAKAFGSGWEGKLVAVPESMWEPVAVSNVPKTSFSTQIVR